MPRKTKDAPGRVTPKGGGGARRPAAPGGSPPSASTGRYTAPIPATYRTSPRWFPYLVLALFLCGLLMIVLNYLGVMPGHTTNAYLFGGLGLIVAGFIASTRWH